VFKPHKSEGSYEDLAYHFNNLESGWPLQKVEWVEHDPEQKDCSQNHGGDFSVVGEQPVKFEHYDLGHQTGHQNHGHEQGYPVQLNGGHLVKGVDFKNVDVVDFVGLEDLDARRSAQDNQSHKQEQSEGVLDIQPVAQIRVHVRVKVGGVWGERKEASKRHKKGQHPDVQGNTGFVFRCNKLFNLDDLTGCVKVAIRELVRVELDNLSAQLAYFVLRVVKVLPDLFGLHK
jgi:hypothetical protein